MSARIHRKLASRERTGFSLLELLVVVAVLGLLAVLVVPSLQGVLGGRRLDTAANIVSSQLQLARQTALSRNALVQWQIVKVPDPRSGDPAAFRLVRCLIMESGSRQWKPLGRTEWLPIAYWVDEDATRSPLLNQSTTAAGISPANSPAAWVTFDGAGRVTLSSSGNWLTLVGRSNPADIIAVQIDPVNGRVRNFRPGA